MDLAEDDSWAKGQSSAIDNTLSHGLSGRGVRVVTELLAATRERQRGLREERARARESLEAGNVYLNRGITGALVGRQPFGGYRLSGIGSKAGGPDYLLQFMVPRTVTENTLRRGFAPPPEPA